MAKLAEEGFFAINVPKTYGGEGGTVIDEMIFFEEISKALPVLAWTAGDVILYGSNIIKTNGSDAQKEAYLSRLVQGKMLFCFALTEPDAGSDAASIRTAAEPADGGWVINGNKMFISGASVADIAVTNTRTAASKYQGITAFLVDTRSPGYKAMPIKKLGYKGSDTCEVVYDQVRVAENDILGGPECLNQGWQQMMRLLNGERLVLSACSLGIAERVLSHLIPFVRERGAAAKPAGRYQDVEHRVVELVTEVEAARRLAYYAAWMVTEGKPCVKETSMTKYFCAETAKKVATEAMRIMGNHAWAVQSSVQRFFRDVPILSVGGGTSQIQKNIIAKTLGL